MGKEVFRHSIRRLKYLSVRLAIQIIFLITNKVIPSHSPGLAEQHNLSANFISEDDLIASFKTHLFLISKVFATVIDTLISDCSFFASSCSKAFVSIRLEFVFQFLKQKKTENQILGTNIYNFFYLKIV